MSIIISVPWGTSFSNLGSCWESDAVLNSFKKPWDVFREVFGVWLLKPLWAVKSVRVMRGCEVRFVPRWKRGRWKSKA